MPLAFQIKDFTSIVASIVNHMRGTTTKITDFQPGSVARTLVEGPAVEVEELYLQMFIGLREAIPVATFLSFGFDKLPARYARGFASISIETPLTAPLLISAGTVFTAQDGRTYISSADVTWAAGENVVRVPITATQEGLAGNIAAGVITSSPAFGSDYTISNSAIDNGSDAETDEEREARFAEFVKALSRGTVDACLYAAKMARVLDADGNLVEYVTRTGIIEMPGYVKIYIYSSAGVASVQLIANAQKIINGSRDDQTGAITPGYRSGGVRVDIMPMVQRAVPFAVQVEMLSGYSLTAAVKQQMSDTFSSTVAAAQPGTVLLVGAIVDELLSIAGVKKVVPLTNENIVCGQFEALIGGTFTAFAL